MTGGAGADIVRPAAFATALADAGSEAPFTGLPDDMGKIASIGDTVAARSTITVNDERGGSREMRRR